MCSWETVWRACPSLLRLHPPTHALLLCYRFTKSTFQNAVFHTHLAITLTRELFTWNIRHCLTSLVWQNHSFSTASTNVSNRNKNGYRSIREVQRIQALVFVDAVGKFAGTQFNAAAGSNIFYGENWQGFQTNIAHSWRNLQLGAYSAMIWSQRVEMIICYCLSICCFDKEMFLSISIFF